MAYQIEFVNPQSSAHSRSFELLESWTERDLTVEPSQKDEQRQSTSADPQVIGYAELFIPAKTLKLTQKQGTSSFGAEICFEINLIGLSCRGRLAQGTQCELFDRNAHLPLLAVFDISHTWDELASLNCAYLSTHEKYSGLLRKTQHIQLELGGRYFSANSVLSKKESFLMPICTTNGEQLCEIQSSSTKLRPQTNRLHFKEKPSKPELLSALLICLYEAYLAQLS